MLNNLLPIWSNKSRLGVMLAYTRLGEPIKFEIFAYEPPHHIHQITKCLD